MSALSVTTLELSGYNGRIFPARLLRLPDAPSSYKEPPVGVFFPGLLYTCDMPLLYYPAQLLLERGASVIQVFADYSQPSFRSLPVQEQGRWLAADAQAALAAAHSQSDSTRLVLVGKSLGTVSLASLHTGAPQAITIWLTPLLHHPLLVEAARRYKGPSLFVVGTGDATYDASALSTIRQDARAEALLIQDADHSLEIRGDIQQSMQVLQDIIRNMAEFLDRHLR